jgi:uncharacterized membrane protein
MKESVLFLLACASSSLYYPHSLPMLLFFKIYLIAVPIFLLIDLLWLGVIAKGIYRKYIGHLMLPSPNWPIALLFYFLFIAGLLIFVIIPALKSGSWTDALLYGALFGFFTYMTFDLTNLAVLKDWPWKIVIIDIIWGVVLSATVSVATFFAARYFFSL